MKRLIAVVMMAGLTAALGAGSGRAALSSTAKGTTRVCLRDGNGPWLSIDIRTGSFQLLVPVDGGADALTEIGTGIVSTRGCRSGFTAGGFDGNGPWFVQAIFDNPGCFGARVGQWKAKFGRKEVEVYVTNYPAMSCPVLFIRGDE